MAEKAKSLYRLEGYKYITVNYTDDNGNIASKFKAGGRYGIEDIINFLDINNGKTVNDFIKKHKDYLFADKRKYEDDDKIEKALMSFKPVKNDFVKTFFTTEKPITEKKQKKSNADDKAKEDRKNRMLAKAK